MLNDLGKFNLIIWVWLVVAACTFLLLMFVRAPYGRHERPGWGPRIPARWGWIIMESPCIIFMTLFFTLSISKWSQLDPLGITFYLMWMGHYIHRSWIWPARAHIASKKMPVSIAVLAVIFNSINSWLNAEWIFNLNHPYHHSWLHSPQFITGLTLFIVGMTINIKTDNILFSLRRKGGEGYKIPRGHMYKWISCPNYFGEILEWIGWAIATWSLAGLSFAIWTIANLAPRARANHNWYQENFSDYPKERKALIPKIW